MVGLLITWPSPARARARLEGLGPLLAAEVQDDGLDGFGPLRRSARAMQRLLEVLLAFLGQ